MYEFIFKFYDLPVIRFHAPYVSYTVDSKSAMQTKHESQLDANRIGYPPIFIPEVPRHRNGDEIIYEQYHSSIVAVKYD